MKVLVCGSRTITDISKVVEGMYASQFEVGTLISGGAKGVDQLAEKIVSFWKKPIEVFKPDWNKHGKKAGILRNIEMVNAADAVVAIWDGKSRGTKSTIDYTRKLGKPLYIYEVN